MDPDKFDAALVLLEDEVILNPLTPVQRGYLELRRLQLIEGKKKKDASVQIYSDYVVEVMCDAAAYYATSPRPANAPVGHSTQRVALLARCLRLLLEET